MFSKREFLVRSVDFLIHIISKKSIDVDLKMTDAIKSWPRPLSSLEIRSFLGLVCYYKRYDGFFFDCLSIDNVDSK